MKSTPRPFGRRFTSYLLLALGALCGLAMAYADIVPDPPAPPAAAPVPAAGPAWFTVILTSGPALLLIVQQVAKLFSTLTTAADGTHPAAGAPGWYVIAHYLCDALLRIKLDQIAPIPGAQITAKGAASAPPEANARAGSAPAGGTQGFIRLKLLASLTFFALAALFACGCASNATTLTREVVATNGVTTKIISHYRVLALWPATQDISNYRAGNGTVQAIGETGSHQSTDSTNIANLINLGAQLGAAGLRVAAP